ncbi:MAG: hypothetical protein MUE84_17000, partial [Hyphomonas sp.]|nr:hypothetical protein [Hyphomonas sp.]
MSFADRFVRLVPTYGNFGGPGWVGGGRNNPTSLDDPIWNSPTDGPLDPIFRDHDRSYLERDIRFTEGSEEYIRYTIES